LQTQHDFTSGVTEKKAVAKRKSGGPHALPAPVAQTSLDAHVRKRRQLEPPAVAGDATAVIEIGDVEDVIALTKSQNKQVNWSFARNVIVPGAPLNILEAGYIQQFAEDLAAVTRVKWKPCCEKTAGKYLEMMEDMVDEIIAEALDKIVSESGGDHLVSGAMDAWSSIAKQSFLGMACRYIPADFSALIQVCAMFFLFVFLSCKKTKKRATSPRIVWAPHRRFRSGSNISLGPMTILRPPDVRRTWRLSGRWRRRTFSP
jgi:hypothetical protein